MKKTLALTLAVIGIIALAGCSSAEDAQKKAVDAVLEDVTTDEEIGKIIDEIVNDSNDADKQEEKKDYTITPLGELPDNATYKTGSFEYSGESVEVLCQKLRDYLGDQYEEKHDDGGDYFFDVIGNTDDGFMMWRVFTKFHDDVEEGYYRVVLRNYPYDDQLKDGTCTMNYPEVTTKYSFANVTNGMTSADAAKTWTDKEKAPISGFNSPAMIKSMDEQTAALGCHAEFYGMDNTNGLSVEWSGFAK